VRRGQVSRDRHPAWHSGLAAAVMPRPRLDPGHRRHESSGANDPVMSRRLHPKPSETETATAIYYSVKAHETFETAAQRLFELVQKAQRTRPGRRRIIYLDIEGHRNARGGFDDDMLELQERFLIGFLGEFVAELGLPLGHVVNPNGQRDDLPEHLEIRASPEGLAN
jgi:hypothetical protein